MSQVRTAFAALALVAPFFLVQSAAAEDGLVDIRVCDLLPELCPDEPVLIGIDPDLVPCIIDPDACTPPVVEPEPEPEPEPEEPASFEPDFVFMGPAVLKVKGQGKLPAAFFFALATAPSGLWVGSDSSDTEYSGAWEPVGRSGHKARLYLDPASEAALAANVSGGATAISGRPMTVQFTKRPKLVLKFRNDGAPTLKIKAMGVDAATGQKVRFKAKLEAGGLPVRTDPLENLIVL